MKLEKNISLNWKKYPVGFKLGKKIQFIKLDISNWRIGKIQFRKIGGKPSTLGWVKQDLWGLGAES